MSGRTRLDRARSVTAKSLELAAVSVLASFLSVGRLQRALDSPPGGGVTFPLPTGLPTLWTYTNLPGVGVSVAPNLGNAGLVLFGLVVVSLLEAGFLGSLDARVDGVPVGTTRFLSVVDRFGTRIVAANLVRFGIVAAVALVGSVFLPLAVVGIVVVSYALYGWSYVIVVRDEPVGEALGVTLALAREGGAYLQFGVAHVVAGAILSVPLTFLVRNGGIAGVVVAAVVAGPAALLAASYGVLVFRDETGRNGGGGLRTTGPDGDPPRNNPERPDTRSPGDEDGETGANEPGDADDADDGATGWEFPDGDAEDDAR